MTSEDYAGRFVRAPQPLRDEHSDKRRLVLAEWQREENRRAVVAVLVMALGALGLAFGLGWALEKVVGQ